MLGFCCVGLCVQHLHLDTCIWNTSHFLKKKHTVNHELNFKARVRIEQTPFMFGKLTL